MDSTPLWGKTTYSKSPTDGHDVTTVSDLLSASGQWNKDVYPVKLYSGGCSGMKMCGLGSMRNMEFTPLGRPTEYSTQRESEETT